MLQIYLAVVGVVGFGGIGLASLIVHMTPGLFVALSLVALGAVTLLQDRRSF